MGPDPNLAAVRSAVRTLLDDLAAGDLVLVACSGGADSLALAAATAFEAPKAGLRAGAVTVDHDLQRGSGERAQAVAAVLRDLPLEPAEVVRVTVGTAGGPEAAAREARYAALGAVADRLGAAAVLLGHTADDQAETVLLGLARGSGARSLAGMAPVSGRYRRPLLALDRATVRAACHAAGLTPWEDPHNTDPAYARARARHDALPVLEKALGPGVAAALARTARLLRDDADALDAWAARATTDCRHPEGGLDCDRLAALPSAVRRRVIRTVAIEAGSPAGALFAVHVAAVDALVVAWHGQQGVDLPGRVTATRRYGRLLLARDGPRDHA
jgi:tRNA(Ile)-lysidine synthase